MCGWRVHSELALPELAAWSGDDRVPDLVIRTGSIPPQLEEAMVVSPLLQVTREGQARLAIDGVATYWLRSPHEIVIAPIVAPDAPDIRTFLFGTMLGLLIHQRGLFPLHASAVQIGNKAIAMAGMSGAGKSTFAAALTRRGHKLLCDDVCVIDSQAAPAPLVRPAFPRVKLWKDALDAMGIAAADLPANRMGQQKYYLRFDDAADFEIAPVPLGSIYLLTPGRAPVVGQGDIRRLPPMAAVMTLHGQIYRHRSAQVWGLEPRLFAAAGRIASTVGVHHLTRSGHLADLDDWVRRVEAHAES
ncbi:hypothetical protein [Bradyrhizobium sp. HKCCYLS20291]|uniref:hypothetical protein n=1 Tax=Bradyrhizobium sp. HKCCYLS20291 TaxID=3420766 RepID=UPI003EBD9E99